MKLEAYLAANPHLTLDAFGALVGASGATVSRWIAENPQRRLRPSWRNIARIKQATGGQVTEADFAPEPPQMPPPPQQAQPGRRRQRFAQAVVAAKAARA